MKLSVLPHLFAVVSTAIALSACDEKTAGPPPPTPIAPPHRNTGSRPPGAADVGPSAPPSPNAAAQPVDSGQAATLFALPSAQPGCLPAGLSWGLSGGRFPSHDEASIENCRTVHLVRSSGRDAASECRVELTESTARELTTVLKHPGVLSAFGSAQPGESKIFGFDERETDGQIWLVSFPPPEDTPENPGPPSMLGRNRTLGIGACRDGSVCASDAVYALKDALRAVENKALNDPACAAAKKAHERY